MGDAHATGPIGLDVRAPEPFQAADLNVQLARAHFAGVAGSAHVVKQSAGVIGRSPAESVSVYLSLRGDSWFQSLRGTRNLARARRWHARQAGHSRATAAAVSKSL